MYGPLYHLLRAEDRERAVRNCLAVCKPGGLAYLAYISVNAAAFYFLREQPAGILDPKEADYFDAFVRGSDFGGQGFTQVHYEAVGRVVPTMEALGLETLHLVGAEGILNPYKHNLAGQAPEVIDRWIELALKICERPDLLGCAEHLLYIGRKGPTCNC